MIRKEMEEGREELLDQLCEMRDSWERERVEEIRKDRKARNIIVHEATSFRIVEKKS